MSDLLLQASDEFDTLVSVWASSELPFSQHEPSLDQCDEWCFEFRLGRFFVAVNREFDTVRIEPRGAAYSYVVVVTDQCPLESLIGCRLRWGWLLTNQRGYTDGVQLEFARDGQTWILQLVAEASLLTAYSLAPLERLSSLP